jgi:bifunctional non-homologous end joining protein LigD
MLERAGERVRLITRGGYDGARRYPSIVEAARKNRQTRFVIDGEAIVRGVDSYSDFNALHSGKHNKEVGFEAVAVSLPVRERGSKQLRG